MLTQEGAEKFLDLYTELFELVGGGYRREGKRYLTVAIGCTGGKHRSVAIAEELARRWSEKLTTDDGTDSTAFRVVHRDLGRE